MSRHRTIESRSDWLASLRSVLVGFGFFFLGSMSDIWLQQHARTRLIAIITDVALGMAAGLVVLFYERRQEQNLMGKLQVIRLMNHHVRNSLQVISLQPTFGMLWNELNGLYEKYFLGKGKI